MRTYSSTSREVLSALRITHVLKHNDASESGFAHDDSSWKTKDEWILFPKRFDPVVFEAIMNAAQCGSIAPKRAHDVIAPQQAVELVSSEHLGVAIPTQPSPTDFHPDGELGGENGETVPRQRKPYTKRRRAASIRSLATAA
jgi:hypothetical protein